MSKALLIVDYQNDFIDGSLAVPDADMTREPIIRLATSGEYDAIFLSRDWHPVQHASFDAQPKYTDYSWPTHCVQGSKGAEFDSALKEALSGVHVVTKGTDLNLDAYSAFEGVVDDWDFQNADPYDPLVPVKLADALRELKVTEVDVVGLALDYCVKASALDSYRNGFQTRVIIEGTRPVAYETGAEAIAELVEAGVKVER